MKRLDQRLEHAPHITHLANAGTTLASAGGGAVSSLAAAGGDAVSTLAAAGGDAVSTLAPAINTAARNLPTVLAHEAELPRVFVHLSAFAGIRGMMSSNMIVLRALALLSARAGRPVRSLSAGRAFLLGHRHLSGEQCRSSERRG